MRGGADWLPILGVLIILAFLLKCVDRVATYIQNRRRRRVMRLEESILDDTFDHISMN